jgi:membrane protein implicated in regulation of membrane protease activity
MGGLLVTACSTLGLIIPTALAQSVRVEGGCMSWWGWTIAGATLLGAELIFVNAQFYLVFVGSAALVVGIITALSPGFAAWGQWTAFGVLAIVSMVLFRNRVYHRLARHAPGFRTGPVGGTITLPVSLGPGESCQTEHGGTFWTVLNDSGAPIPSGTQARIERVQGLTLLIRPAA